MEEDDLTLDTIWENVEKLCSQAVHSSTPTEMFTSDPFSSQMEKKSRVQSDGGPPPPPPPPGPGGPLPVTSEPKTKVEKARAYKPRKKMNKVNWSVIKKGRATDAGVIWQKAAEGEMDTKVDVDPVKVEELFAKPEVKQVEEKPKAVEEKGPKDKVYVWKVALPWILKYCMYVDTCW